MELQIPTVSKVVDVDSLDLLARSLIQEHGIDIASRLLSCKIKKLCRGLYVLDYKFNCDVTPSLVNTALSLCPVQAYYIRTFEKHIVTLDGLTALVRGKLVHMVYSRKFKLLNKEVKRSNRQFRIVTEVELEGKIGKYDVHGRVDILTVDNSTVVIIEVKSSHRVGKGAKLQAWCYSKLLDVDPVKTLVVSRKDVVTVIEDYTTVFTKIARILLNSSEPPYKYIHEFNIEPKCRLCGFKIFCEYYRNRKRKEKQT